MTNVRPLRHFSISTPSLKLTAQSKLVVKEKEERNQSKGNILPGCQTLHQD